MSQRITATKSQAGFTLVELAIVMIIIGLLIGGVLKGQELIGNAQVTATVAQIKSIDAGVSTFKDTYQYIPGDLPSPDTRLAGCTAAPCLVTGATLGNGRLENVPSAAPSTEALAFFPQLAAANLITGIVPGNGSIFGGALAGAKISGNGFQPGYSLNSVAADFTGAIGTVTVAPNSGLYLALTNTPNAAISTSTVGLKPTEASRIDAKIDDGIPDTGSVRGIGATGATGCGVVGVGYSTSVTSNQCGLYLKIQS